MWQTFKLTKTIIENTVQKNTHDPTHQCVSKHRGQTKSWNTEPLLTLGNKDKDRYKELQAEFQYKSGKQTNWQILEEIKISPTDYGRISNAKVKNYRSCTIEKNNRFSTGMLQPYSSYRFRLLVALIWRTFNITEKGVYKLMRNQKTHKATSLDDIPAFILSSAHNH